MRSLLDRRTFLSGGTAIASLGLSSLLSGFPADDDGTPIPFLDAPPPNAERTLLQWDQLRSWITPNAQFFSVAHYDKPEVAGDNWRLDVGGLLGSAKSFSLQAIKARPRRE